MTAPQLKKELDEVYSMRENAKHDAFWKKECDERILKLLRENMKESQGFEQKPIDETKLFL